MARVIVYLLLLFLSNSCLETVDAQSTKGKTSWDIITEVGTLTRAVESLQAKIDGQAALLRNLTAKEEMSTNALNNFEEKLSALENLLSNIETKVDAQANSLSTLEAESKTQNSLLDNLQATTVAMQAKLLNIFEEKFSVLANLVNNVMAEDQKQVTSLNNLENKADTQAALLNNLNANVQMQSSSLGNLETESILHKNSLKSLESSDVGQTNELNNLKSKVDTQNSILNNLQSTSNMQAALLSKLNSNQELQATSLSNLEAASELHKSSINNLGSTAAKQTNLLNNLEANADMQATLLTILQAQSNVQVTSLNNLVTEVEWREPVPLFKTNRTIFAVEGDNVEIWCVVRGTPLPEIKWTRDNSTMESDRVTIENNGKVLRIQRAQLTDEGIYVCVAANGVGTPARQFVHLEVYGKFQQCNGTIESDKGNLEVQPSSASCLSVIQLQNTTGFRVEWDPLMTEPILVIPEQSPSNSTIQSIRPTGSKNASHQFEGKTLAIVVPPRLERTSLSWTGLDLDGSRVASSAKLVEEMEGSLEWESRGDGIDNIFWVFDHDYHEFTQELNWTLNSDLAARDQENLCENISFYVLQITRYGNISEIQRTCDGSSVGSVTMETSSQVLVLLHMKSVEATKSKLWVSWAHHDKPLKINVDGVVAGTQGGAINIPFNSTKTKTLSSKYIFGVTFDWNSRRLYQAQKNVGILKSDLDGNESEILVSDLFSSLWGITIDPITGNIYYGNRTSRTIRVCNTNMNKCSTICKSNDLSNVYVFAVHRSKGILFWSIWNTRIVRANLDGSNVKVILERGVRGLDVDELEDRLYWGSESGIGSCDLNGQDIRLMPNLNFQVQDVAIDNDRVYYVHWNNRSIHVTSKSGTNSRMIAQSTSAIEPICLYGTKVSTNNPPNPCEKSKCTHLCVLVTRWSYRCLCPDNEQLDKDGETCKV